MHFEILIEDLSGKTFLDILMPKIISDDDTFSIHHYKGIGHLPKTLKSSSNPRNTLLLNKLPKLIQGYGQTFSSYPDHYEAVLIVVCDLDSRCFKEFRQELLDCYNRCTIKPELYFCIAIQEGEAWYLGDLNAIKKAYPSAKDSVLSSYDNESICGTWEQLADVIVPGGAKKLSKSGYSSVGKVKNDWANHITPHMNVDKNKSPSFCYFRDKLRYISSRKNSI